VRPTQLVLGLGNPGSRYQETRHNAGFAVLETLASRRGFLFSRPLFHRYRRHTLNGAARDLVLCQPLTFMNRSGYIVPALLRKYGLEPDTLLVIVDNMDLQPGKIRVKRTGGSSSHNGIRSVGESIGTFAFPRMYLGIGSPGVGVSVIEHVLGTFESDEANLFRETVGRAAGLLELLAETDFDTFLSAANSS